MLLQPCSREKRSQKIQLTSESLTELPGRNSAVSERAPGQNESMTKSRASQWKDVQPFLLPKCAFSWV